MTHFHRDHISGLMAKDTDARTSPRRRFGAGRGVQVLDRSTTTAGAAKRIQAVFPTWKNMKQFEGDKEVAPGVKPIYRLATRRATRAS